MQGGPPYADIVGETAAYLEAAAERALEAGLPRDRIILDPGIGFGKGLEDNLLLLAHLAEIGRVGYPLLIGLSRKSLLGELTGREAGDRLAATLAANAAALLLGGAAILRVHDTAAAADLVKVIHAIRVVQ
jgi:dihydropteroate synthase